MRNFWIIPIAFLLSSCVKVEGQPKQPDKTTASHQNFVTQFESFQQNAHIGLAALPEPVYRPETVLPALDTYFQINKTVLKKSIDGHEALILTKIPANILTALMNAAFDDKHSTGFAVLQSSFWKMIGDLQSQGFITGFLVPDASFLVNGVYFPDKKAILVDVLANQSVLIHEYRHHQQRMRLMSRLTPEVGKISLSMDCLAEASQFFGEVDSTNMELTSWIGVFQMFDVTPAFHKQIMTSENRFDWDKNKCSQASEIQANLIYPFNASKWLKPDHCPNVLIETAKAIGQLAQAEADEASNYGVQLLELRYKHLNLQQKLLTTCKSNPSDSKCADLPETIAAIPSKAQELKDEFDQYIQKESISRPEKIRQILQGLPHELHADLCKYASGFENLNNCQGEL